MTVLAFVIKREKIATSIGQLFPMLQSGILQLMFRVFLLRYQIQH